VGVYPGEAGYITSTLIYHLAGNYMNRRVLSAQLYSTMPFMESMRAFYQVVLDFIGVVYPLSARRVRSEFDTICNIITLSS
jgi:hypothetical protein